MYVYVRMPEETGSLPDRQACLGCGSYTVAGVDGGATVIQLVTKAERSKRIRRRRSVEVEASITAPVSKPRWP